MNRRSFIGMIASALGLALIPFRGKLLAPTMISSINNTDRWVKIGMIPRIVEDTDRWGMPMSTYSVLHGTGYVSREKWRELYEFENHDACGGKEENVAAVEWIKANPDSKIEDIPVPLMKKRIKRSLVEQFNVCTTNPDLNETGTTEYIRMCAFFNEKTLVEWKPEHDAMLARLQYQCDKMNA